jgi:hypothetical protein
MTSDNPVRPGPLRWLRYAVGGGLPPRYREWVLHDVTARTWWLRQLARALVLALPVGVVVGLLIPGSPGIRVAAVLGGLLVTGIYVVAFIDEAVEHRSVKAGFPYGYAKAVREQREVAEQRPRR